MDTHREEKEREVKVKPRREGRTDGIETTYTLAFHDTRATTARTGGARTTDERRTESSTRGTVDPDARLSRGDIVVRHAANSNSVSSSRSARSASRSTRIDRSVVRADGGRRDARERAREDTREGETVARVT